MEEATTRRDGGPRRATRKRLENLPVEPEAGRLALSVPEVAWLMNVSVAVAWKLVADGELPSFKVKRRRLIARVAVEDFIARGGHVPAEAS